LVKKKKQNLSQGKRQGQESKSQWQYHECGRSNVASDESQSADEYMAEAMECNFMNMKELNNTLDDQGAFVMNAYEHQ
jgi:hypothetical protein